VAFSINGESLTEETVSLDAGETTYVPVSFSLEVKGGQEYTIETADDTVSGTISVDPVASDGSPERTSETITATSRSDDPSTETGDGFGPGFGAVAALLALLFSVVGVHRRT